MSRGVSSRRGYQRQTAVRDRALAPSRDADSITRWIVEHLVQVAYHQGIDLGSSELQEAVRLSTGHRHWIITEKDPTHVLHVCTQCAWDAGDQEAPFTLVTYTRKCAPVCWRTHGDGSERGYRLLDEPSDAVGLYWP